jgi:hypothetical protein
MNWNSIPRLLKEFSKLQLVVIYLVLLFISLVKSIPMMKNPSLWAEELVVIIGPNIQQKIDGNQSLNFEKYAGQYWVLQNLISEAITFLGLDFVSQTPRLLIAISISLGVALLLPWLSQRVTLLDKRLVVAFLICVVISSYSWEVFGNLANIHSYLFIGMLSFALRDPYPQSRINLTFESAFILICAFTGITGLFLLVVLAFRFWIFRARQVFFQFLVTLVLVVYQIPLWTDSRTSSDNRIDLSNERIIELLDVTVKRVFSSLPLGQENTIILESSAPYGWLDPYRITGALTALLVVAALIYLKNGVGEHSQIVWFAYLVASMLTVFWILVIMTSLSVPKSSLMSGGVMGRYIFLTNLMLLLIGFISLQLYVRQKRSGISNSHFPLNRLIQICIAGIFVFFFSGALGDISIDPKGDSKSQSEWENFINCINIDQTENCKVSVAPGRGWSFTVTQ